MSVAIVMTYFTKSPDACEVGHQRAREIKETLLNDFCRLRVKYKPSMDQRKNLKSKYFAKSLRLQASMKVVLSQCAHSLMDVVERLIMDLCLQLPYFIDSRKLGHSIPLPLRGLKLEWMRI